MCRPTPDSGSLDLVLCLKRSCVSSYCPCSETPAPDLSNTAGSEYQMSGPVSHFSDQPRQTQSLPSLCLNSRLASPTLTSTDGASHHKPDQVTRLRHTVTLGCFTPAWRILCRNANKLADLHLVSLHELSRSLPAFTCYVWLCYWSGSSLEPTTTLLDNDISITHVHDIGRCLNRDIPHGDEIK